MLYNKHRAWTESQLCPGFNFWWFLVVNDTRIEKKSSLYYN